MKQEVSNLDLHSKIHFVGHKSDIADFLSADIMVHTSRAESQGRGNSSGNGSPGTPVIAYDVGGIHESLVDRETRFWFHFGQKGLIIG